MKKIFVICLLSMGVFASAQSPKSFKEIPFYNKKDVAANVAFFVENVYDGRQFQDNIGTVQTGAFNSLAFATTVKPLQQELKNYFEIVYPKSDARKPISVRVIDMYVSELTENFSETGYASVVIDVIENVDGNPFIVGRFSASEEGKGLDVTGKHDERLKSCIAKCLQNYVSTSEAKKESIPFALNPKVNSLLPSKVSPGIFYDYSDLLNNTPQDTANFYLTGTEGKKYVTSKKSGQVLQHYYAVSDKNALYVNIAKYAKEGYYAKADIIGNKFFIEDVVYNEKTSPMWGAMFGLVGALIANAASNKDGSVPMLIDALTGKPTFLTDAAMKKLLAPYPAVLKDYKKGERKASDIKAALRKVITPNPTS